MDDGQSHDLPGCCGMNWTEADKRDDPKGWADHLIAAPRKWRIDGYPIRGSLMQTWKRLDWSRAYEDKGPSPAGNPGPYWHVAEILDDDEIWHRLYPANAANRE